MRAFLPEPGAEREHVRSTRDGKRDSPFLLIEVDGQTWHVREKFLKPSETSLGAEERSCFVEAALPRFPESRQSRWKPQLDTLKDTLKRTSLEMCPLGVESLDVQKQSPPWHMGECNHSDKDEW
ncbi:hypothetical protein AOLI_G00125780 [Acnodon oligacanthus]